MKRLLYASIIIVSFAWFNHSLERNLRIGYDFPIFYAAAHHQFLPGWVYSNHLWVFFAPLSLAPVEVSFGVWYGLLVLVWLDVARRYPVLSVLAAYPMLLSLELGASAPVMAWLCLSFPGAVLASCFKPYLVVFVILHAVRRANALYRQRRGAVPAGVLQDEPDSVGATYRDYFGRET